MSHVTCHMSHVTRVVLKGLNAHIVRAEAEHFIYSKKINYFEIAMLVQKLHLVHLEVLKEMDLERGWYQYGKGLLPTKLLRPRLVLLRSAVTVLYMII